MGIPNFLPNIFIVLFLSTVCLEVYGENKILFKSHLTCLTVFLIFICWYLELWFIFFCNYLQYSIDRLHNLFTHSFFDTFSLFSSLLKQRISLLCLSESASLSLACMTSRLMLGPRVCIYLISLCHQLVLQSDCVTLYLDQQCLTELLYVFSDTWSGGCKWNTIKVLIAFS